MAGSAFARGIAVGVLVTAGTVLRPPEAKATVGTITKGPWVQRVTSETAIVRVEVEPPQAVSLELGLGPHASSEGRRVIESSEPKALHSLAVTGLRPATRYAYSVRAGGASKFGAFVTAPPDDSDAPFRFLVYGDDRTDHAAHAAVVRAMVPVPSDFLVHTGDFVDRGESASQWQTFFDIEAPLLRARALFSGVGSHERTDGADVAYARYFGPAELPESNDAAGNEGAPAVTRPEQLVGTFRWGNTRFFLLNGMLSDEGTPARARLERMLAEADAEPSLVWRVAVIHHGPWSSGPHGGDARLHRAGIVPLLKAHKIDLVLSGHDPIYERGWADGIAYVVSGGGGAPVDPIETPIPESRKTEAVRHFVEMTVSRSSMRLVAMRADGSTIERCVLDKSTGEWGCDRPPEEASTTKIVSGARAEPPGARGRCSCDVVGGPGGGAGIAVVLGALALWRFRRSSRA